MFKLKIDNEQFDFFNNVTINLDFNSIASSFSFQGLADFTPAPLEYNQCQVIDDNNNILITGTILNPGYSATNKPEPVNVSGYSLPGILEDCEIPVSLYPLQSDNLSLIEILDKLLQPFGIKYIFTSNVSADLLKKYKKTSAEPGQRIKSYINNLASQRGVILTHDNLGNLVFTRLEPDLLPVEAEFNEGNPGISEISLQVDAQQMHSEITVLKQASTGSPNSGEAKIENPYVPIFRPKVMILTDGDLFDVEKAARNELGNELRNIVLTIRTTKFVEPGKKIKVRSPSNKIKVFSEFIVESTVINATSRSIKYDLTCVPVDVFTATEVENIFDKQSPMF